MPVEVAEAVAFDQDFIHQAYDGEYVEPFWAGGIDRRWKLDERSPRRQPSPSSNHMRQSD